MLRFLPVLCSALLALGCAKPPVAPPPPPPSAAPAAAAPAEKRRVIVFVWDGLRPDSIDPVLTPELAKLRDERGVNFKNHHSVYPTFTMMNAAAFATGARSGVHGFYGNFEYQPGPTGKNAKNHEFDFDQPFFTEDHAVLQALDAYYRAQGKALLRTQTLFEAAHEAGLRTAAIGKTGPAFLQDYRQDGSTGVVIDENVVLPRAFGLGLQAAGIPLPKHTVHQQYPDGTLELAADNGDPTSVTEPSLVTLADGDTADPRATAGSAHNARNAYMMRVFTDYVLPKLDPDLSMIWLRNPDSTQHAYGPGTPPVLDALRHQDQLLGELLRTLDKLGRSSATDLLIASDHGHSSIASDPKLFPTRALVGEPNGEAELGAVAAPGFIVSGDIRSPEWLRHAGFAHVYDGVGCVHNPVLAGVDARGKALHPTQADETCEKTEFRKSTGDYRVPKGKLAADAIIIAANGGSEYFYVPSQDERLVRKLVTALQERRAYGALFVRERYAAIPGTLSLARIGMEQSDSASPPTPDVVVSFDWDDTAESAAAPGVPGTEHASPQNNRGTHGSFSPVDVHNTLIAVGPDFRAGYADDYPSSTLDVATTIAKIFNLALPHAEGRVLTEALASQATPVRYRVEHFEEHVGPVPLARTCGQDDLDCKKPSKGLQYAFTLRGQTLQPGEGAQPIVYLDQARATRSPAQKPTSQPPSGSLTSQARP